jgi:hypothetical protein
LLGVQEHDLMEAVRNDDRNVHPKINNKGTYPNPKINNKGGGGVTDKVIAVF